MPRADADRWYEPTGMMAFTSNIFLRDHWVDASELGITEMLVAVFIMEHVALTLMVGQG